MVALGRIAEVVDGLVVGDAGYEIDKIASLEQSTNESLSFFSDLRLVDALRTSAAGAVLISKSNAGLFSGNKVIVADPYLAYAQVTKLFKATTKLPEALIDSSALISKSSHLHCSTIVGKLTTIAENARIGKNAIIGNAVSIGADVIIKEGTVIDDQVVINAGSEIGSRCHISSGAIIGSSGFGYAPSAQSWEKIEQLGHVIIGDDVDVGANTTIDRGALQNTIVGNGVKLDNQIQIAHNVTIGDNTIMAGCTAVAGSSRIGERCKFGGRVSILGHINIVDDVTVMANSLVSSSINKPGEYASMVPVQPVKQWRKNLAIIRRLDRLMRKINKLKIS